jgi:OmcA/MtrC family decaheme c-type cytochrome
MLTGGIGYTYSLGSASTTPQFVTNNQPFTQTNVPGYVYTANASGQAGKGGLIVPALDMWKVATNFTGRRVVVDNSKCSACHVSLGVGPDFHAGQRNDATSCNFCHNPNQSSSGWSGNQKNFVHSIHGAEKRGVQFNWHSTDTYWLTTYPAVLNRCEMCHLPGTYDFSSDAAQAALPNMLSSTVGKGVYATGSVHSPYVAESPTDYGAAFSFSALTGTATQAASTTLIVTPIASACSACHDSPAAVDHMQTNGAAFWQSRSAAAATQQGEQCLICHGPNRLAAISLVHTDKTP